MNKTELRNELNTAKANYLAAIVIANSNAHDFARTVAHDAYVEAKYALATAEGILPI